MDSCIFCKIAAHELQAAIQHEDEKSVAFNDIHPKSRIHILIIPKKHITTIAEMEEGDEKVMGHLIKVAKDLAKKFDCKGYKLLFSVGREGGQEVFHVHLHLMGV